MASKNDEPARKSGGCLGLMMKLFLTIGVTGLAVALGFISIPQDLSNVDGVGPAALSAPKKDIKGILHSAIERGHEVTFTEEEINSYLYRTLATKQNGVLGKNATLDGVWVSLEAGCAEVIMERRLFGHPFTVSTFIQIEQTEQPNDSTKTEVVLHGGPYFQGTYPNRGGRIGRLVVPQGFLLLVKPALEKLAAAFEDEIDLISEMARIRIEDNKIILSPHGPGDIAPGTAGTF